MNVRFITKDKEQLPKLGSEYAAGYDLKSNEDYELNKDSIVVVSTGVYMDMPKNMYAQVCSRSGLAAKFGIYVVNAPGIIDADYKGEIKVILTKISNGFFNIKKGDRIAQLIFANNINSQLNSNYEVVTQYYIDQYKNSSVRGAGSLGSTGN
jgi:dUTP pyrophosphatase